MMREVKGYFCVDINISAKWKTDKQGKEGTLLEQCSQAGDEAWQLLHKCKDSLGQSIFGSSIQTRRKVEYMGTDVDSQ